MLATNYMKMEVSEPAVKIKENPQLYTGMDICRRAVCKAALVVVIFAVSAIATQI